MRVPGLRRRSRAAVSTVIGTVIFIVAALSIFTALAATNVAGMNYQNAAQQAASKNAVKAQEQVQAAPVFDPYGYAEFSAAQGASKVSFGMAYLSPVDWAEAALAVNSTGGAALVQHYTNACPGSQACALTLPYPPAVNDTLILGISMNNVGAGLTEHVSVGDSAGLSFNLQSLAATRSGDSYIASEIWTSNRITSGGADNTVTVTISGASAPSTGFSIFLYDVATGAPPSFVPRQATGLAPAPIGTAAVDGGNQFYLAVVTAPVSWQPLAAPGFTLDASPALPTEVALTNGWASTTVFTSVIYVYHTWSGGAYRPLLGEHVEAFDPSAGTCSSQEGVPQLPPGIRCAYELPAGAVGAGLGRPFNLTDAGQKLSVGFTTSLGNTFWYNYTEYAATFLAYGPGSGVGSGSNGGSPYVPDISDLINTVVARGLGPAKLTFPAFTYYWNGAGAGGIGSGYLLNGYFGFAVPAGASLVWEVNITNYDPQQRGITILSPSQLTLVTASSGASPTTYPILGEITDSADDQAVSAGPFSPISLGYKESAVLRFGSSITKTPIQGPYMAEIVLVGFYDGNVPFAQILPVSATFVMSASVAGSNGNWCKVGTGTTGATCAFTYPAAKGDPKLTAGGTYTFQIKGFGSPTSVYLLTTPAGTESPNFADITGSLRTSAAVSFTVPVSTPPGFYEFDISDGLNRVSVTVQVVAP